MRLALVVVSEAEAATTAKAAAETTAAAAETAGSSQAPNAGGRLAEGDNIRNHIDAMMRLDGIAAVCELGEAKVAGAVAEVSGALPDGMGHYDDLDLMIRAESFDGAVLIPYADMGRAVSLLLGAKKHVFVAGWPAALGAPEASALLRLAEKKGVTLECEQAVSHNAPLSWLRKAVSDRLYGRLLSVGLMRHGDDASVPCVYDYGYGNADSGCIPDGSAGGRSAKAAGHKRGSVPAVGAKVPDARGACARDIQVVNYIFGAVPNVVFARACGTEPHYGSAGLDGAHARADARDEDRAGGRKDDAPAGCMSMLLGYGVNSSSNGGGGVATISSNPMVPRTELRVDATFERAAVTADVISKRITGVPYEHGNNGNGRTTIMSFSDGYHRAPSTRPGHARAHIINMDDRLFDPLEREPVRDQLYSSMSDFVKSVKKKKGRGENRARDALAAARIAEAALLSGRRGIPIYLDLRLQ